MKDEDLVSDGLLSVSESARFLNISRAKLYLVMEAGDLPYVKLGRARRIPRRALVKLAATNLRGGWRVEQE